MTSSPSDQNVSAEQQHIEELTKELLFWRRCWKAERKESNLLRQELNALEAELKDFVPEYGVEDRDGDIVWFCNPEDKSNSLEEQRKDAQEYAMTNTWFDLVSRKVGPPHREI